MNVLTFGIGLILVCFVSLFMGIKELYLLHEVKEVSLNEHAITAVIVIIFGIIAGIAGISILLF